MSPRITSTDAQVLLKYNALRFGMNYSSRATSLLLNEMELHNYRMN
jgi:hypothetical protein